MKVLLIVVAVAIVVLLSFYIGGMIAMTVFLALMFDASIKGVINEEGLQSYSPDVANIKARHKEIMQTLLKDHILIKTLMRGFKHKK